MDLYKKTDTGAPVSTANLGADDLRGYYSFADLKKLLDQNEAVGIRVYNLHDTVQPKRHRLIAVGVKGDGFELEGKYLLSHMDDSSDFHLGAIPMPDRKSALDAASAGTSGFKDIFRRFASYFSTEMINDLAKSGSDGLCFYEVSLASLGNLPSHIEMAKQSLFSHIAVTSNLDQGKVIGINSNTSFNNKLSEIPCPGHCLAINKRTGATSRSVVTNSIDLSASPYLLPWG